MDKEEQYVDIIASGYEWICPNCETYNEEIEALEIVECKNCHKRFIPYPPEHAYKN